MRTKGFTLIELLVVIAIIAVLMGVLMPSLRLAKDHAMRLQCQSNTKTLAMAWFMYQGDNDGKLVSAMTPEIQFCCPSRMGATGRQLGHNSYGRAETDGD